MGMKYIDVIVIGGGAAGLMAAAGAAQKGASVIVLEKMSRPGRKIMITGKGRCNFTNVKAWNEFQAHIHPKPNFLKPSFYNLNSEKMIEFLTEEIHGGERVTDVGCGSGILALAARLCGARECTAYDLDPEAVRVAKKNIADSGLDHVTADVSDLLASVDLSGGPYDFMAANIVADILLRLAPLAPPYIKEGGLLAVSGILSARADEVRDGIAAAGFRFLREKREGDWFAMLFGRV